MKKLLLLLLCMPLIGFGQQTYVPDDNFENFLELNGMGNGLPYDDYVTTANINTVTILSISYLSISDITGLEDFISLVILYVENMQLTTLDVSANTALTTLYCQGNQLTSLDISQNTALTLLWCQSNQLSSLDVSQNTALTTLNCFSNQLTSLDLRNGNNNNMSQYMSSGYFDAMNNPNLECVEADYDPGTGYSFPAVLIDNGSIPAPYFSTNCNPYGCMDPLALNFDPVAILSDSSCCYDCGQIEGFVYEDLDSNAIYDINTDIPLGTQILQLEKSNGEISYLTTDWGGYYSFWVDTGQQILTYFPPAFWQSSNNNTQYSIDIQTDSMYSGLDFGITPDFTKGDMTVDLTTSNTVCNNTTTIWLTVRNEGTETITNVDIDLWVDQAYSIQSVNGAGAAISGNHISWNFPGNFHPFAYIGEEQTFSVDVQIPGGPQGGSFIDSAIVTPVQFNLIEIDSTNNFAQVSNTLLCSFDPNDKQVLPKKCFYNESDTLDYTIRFQNTGNYPATTVTLVDSLDLEKLDILSFHVLGASHDYEWSLKAPSILEVVFDNIMLVDSSVSFNESQGFFKYRIIIRDSLPNLQPTATPAFIYFDSNAPIVTNLPEVGFINPMISSSNVQTICNGQSITVGNSTYTTSGSYTDVFTAANGCDSTVTTNLTVTNSSSLMVKTTCDSYIWVITNQSYNSSGIYTNTTTDTNGCVHIDSLYLTIKISTTSTANVTTCNNSYTWGSQIYSASGTYNWIGTNLAGCDSTAILNLTLNTGSSTSSNTTLSTCNAYVWNGQTYNTSGNYSWIGTNAAGCDSTATLNLTINTPTSSSTNESSCDSYSWNGQIYTTSGNYSWTGVNATGCDSTAALNLTINTSSSLTNTVSICYGESITIGGNTYSQTGTYVDILTGSNSCDSIITTNLTIISQITTFIAQNGNDILVNALGGNTPYAYQWNTGETTQAITPLSNGDYWVIITDINTCESDSAFFTVTWISTSIEELNINKLSIYPNPSNDVFNIVFGSLVRQDLNIRVFNIIGEEIVREDLQQFKGKYVKSFNLNQYTKGIYLLEIETNNGIINKKLILQ